ncbi:MAG TPA: FtsX-like permease family protein [Acholeplasma sp.]|nr:FtsX-like permease family protein [Acholeplasma sp.]
MKLAFEIARRFLASAKKQTLVIILGIAVGVSVQVFIGSLISGLQKDLINTAIGSTSQITVKNKDDKLFIDNYEVVLDDIKSSSKELVNVTPTVNRGGIFTKNTISKEVLLRGFEVETANLIYGFTNKEKLVEGRLPASDNEVMLGIGFKNTYLKNNVSLNLNDTISFEVSPGNSIDLTVVGYFDLGISQVNELWGITNLTTVQNIYGVNQISSIEMQLKDVLLADVVALSLDELLVSKELLTTNWKVEQASLLSGIQGQSISSYMIQVFVIISVVLGIASVLAITVMQKSRQIGILKAMGLTDKDSLLVFLFEGMILGVFGAITGVLLGLGLLYSFTTFAVDQTTGNPVVPINIEASFIVLSAFIAFFASTLSALFPAIRSSKLTVIEVIRNA